jgi:hypothetical protein
MVDTQAASKYLTHDQVITLLASRKGERTLGQFAAEIKISQSLLSNILCGYRKAGAQVLKYLGVRKLTMYVYVRDGDGNGKGKSK